MKVEFIATGRDEQCGISTYTTSLEKALDIEHERRPLKLGSLDLVHYFKQSLGAIETDADIIHIQHEYGIYGPKSIASWFFFPVIWLVSLIRRKPVVITFHSAWGKQTISPPLEGLKKVYVYLNNKMLATVADHAIFLEEDMRDIFESYTDLSSCDVLPHGVQTNLHPMDQDEAKEKFDVVPDSTLVVEPGFVRPQKGYEQFVKIAERSDRYKFMIGGGPQEGNYIDYFKDLEKSTDIQITGVLDEDEFHALFNAMDVAVLPYDVVTQSGIVNWCLAYDVPIVATDLDRFKKLEDEYGFIKTFPEGDTNKAVDAIDEVVENPDKFTKNISKYKQDNGMKSVAKKHKEIYHQIQ